MRPATLQSLKKKLIKVFSEYIRRRDADENGIVSCISCGKQMHWKNSQAGHYKPKSLGLSVYFLETNVHNQCSHCNLRLQGNAHAYGEALKKRYGINILEKIEEEVHRKLKFSKLAYAEMIEHYEEKLRGME